MKSKDIFQLAVRLLGLLFLYHGVQSLPMVMNGPMMVLVYLALQFGMAWWLIGGAKLLVQHAYPDENPASPPDEVK
jgi:hypothetical protein